MRGEFWTNIFRTEKVANLEVGEASLIKLWHSYGIEWCISFDFILLDKIFRSKKRAPFFKSCGPRLGLLESHHKIRRPIFSGFDEWSVGKNIEKDWRSEFDPWFFGGPWIFFVLAHKLQTSSALGIFRAYSSFQWRYRKKGTNFTIENLPKNRSFQAGCCFSVAIFLSVTNVPGSPPVIPYETWRNIFHFENHHLLGVWYHHHSWLTRFFQCFFEQTPRMEPFSQRTFIFAGLWEKKTSISTFACADVHPNPWALPPTNILENKNSTSKHPHISDICPSWCFFQ